MSLDVYLKTNIKIKNNLRLIKDEFNIDLTKIKTKYPYITLELEDSSEIHYTDNITHNLNVMADKCGLYDVLWRPYRLIEGYIRFEDYNLEYEFEDENIIYAKQLINPLLTGLNELKKNKKIYIEYNPDNGWGDYDGLVKFAEDYLNACIKYPNAIVETTR